MPLCSSAEDPSESEWVGAALRYFPNRILDVLDVFRVRVKVGPGLAVGGRVTDSGAFYLGRTHAAYFGLPGPRGGLGIRPPMGLEQTRGAVILGVDASDDLPHAPHYEFTEIGASAHLLLIGGELTFSPGEFWDLICGIFGSDPSRDDLPSKPEIRIIDPFPIIGPVLVEPAFPLEPKPTQFDRLTQRLDYIAENVPLLLRSELHAIDLWLMGDEEAPLDQPPVKGLEIRLIYKMVTDPDGEHTFDPKLDLRLELPNVEHRFSLFLDSTYDTQLPGVDVDDRQDEGWSLGLRRRFDEWKISGDIGVHSGFPPEVFARVYWQPGWQWGEWNWGFHQRLFWENEDGFGLLSSLQGYTWWGEGDRWKFRNLTAGRFSEATDGYEWQQTLSLGHMTRLVEEHRRSRNVGFGDTLECWGVTATLFGEDRLPDEYRLTTILRYDLYDEFVILEIEPGLQWRNDLDWTTQFRMEIGLNFLF